MKYDLTMKEVWSKIRHLLAGVLSEEEIDEVIRLEDLAFRLSKLPKSGPVTTGKGRIPNPFYSAQDPEVLRRSLQPMRDEAVARLQELYDRFVKLLADSLRAEGRFAEAEVWQIEAPLLRLQEDGTIIFIETMGIF